MLVREKMQNDINNLKAILGVEEPSHKEIEVDDDTLDKMLLEYDVKMYHSVNYFLRQLEFNIEDLKIAIEARLECKTEEEWMKLFDKNKRKFNKIKSLVLSKKKIKD